MHLVIPALGPTPRTAPKFVRPQRLGSSQFPSWNEGTQKTGQNRALFLDCPPGGEFHACVVLQSSCTGTTFDEVMRNFELQRDKEFTLHVCADHPRAKSKNSSFIRQPSTVSIVGPGTVLSVHLLDLPFMEPRYAVQYKTDAGELIEVWTPGKDVLVLEGMYGILTYSTHPEKIPSFRVVEQKLTK